MIKNLTFTLLGIIGLALMSCSKEEAPNGLPEPNIIENNMESDGNKYEEKLANSAPEGGFAEIIFQLSGDYAKYVPVRFTGGSLSYPAITDASEPWALDEGYYYSSSQWGATDLDSFINLTWEAYRNGELVENHQSDIIRGAKVTRMVFLPKNLGEIALERHPEFYEEKISYSDALKETMNWLIAEGFPDCTIRDC